MGKCTDISSKTICRRELNKVAKIQKREVGNGGIGNYSAKEVFTDYLTIYCKASTIKGSSKFSGVGIDERATHKFYTTWLPGLKSVEVANYFILFDSRYFEIIEVTNFDEGDDYAVIVAAERGAGEAAKA
jgi:hypothetical protein